MTGLSGRVSVGHGERGGGANWWLQIRLAESASAAAFPTRSPLPLPPSLPPQCPKRIMATVKGNPLAGGAAKCVAGQTDTAATQREGERETAAKRCQVTPPLTPSPRGRRSDCRGQQEDVCYIFTHCSCIRNIFHRSSTVQVFCHCQHFVMARVRELDFPPRSAERGDARFEYECDCPPNLMEIRGT